MGEGQTFSAKTSGWGGARPNAGGARANAGGARPGAGRKPARPRLDALEPADVPRWHCVVTYPHSEFSADAEIRLAGFQVFAPTVFQPERKPRRLSNGAMHPAAPDRVVPLFRRYLFVRFKRSDAWQAIRYLPGVAGFLWAAPDRPAIVPDHAIDLIRGLCSAGNDCIYPSRHSPLFSVGSPARVLEGPLADLSGICTWSDGKRLKLLMTLLGREVTVTVAQAAVEAI